MFFNPNTPHSYHGLTDDWTVHLVTFVGPACIEILKALRMYESGVYHFSDQSVFLEHVQSMLYLKDRKNINIQQEFSKACYSFLLDLSDSIRRIDMSAPIQENQTVNEVLAYLEEHYEKPVTLDELAEQVGLSKEYLCMVYKKEMNQTIMHTLLRIRLGRARVFLHQYPDKRVWEIGEMCGFESPSYFGKKFKELMGCTPEQFRKW